MENELTRNIILIALGVLFLFAVFMILKPSKKHPLDEDQSDTSEHESETKPCPYCGEEILSIAIKCKHCRTSLKKKKPKVGIIVGLIIALALAALVALEYFPSLMGSKESSLENSAIPLVTDILHEQLGYSTDCIAISIDKEVAENHYRATAYLNNGSDIIIMIELRGDKIAVTIPNQ